MKRRLTKLLPGLAAFVCVVACAPTMASSQPARSDRIAIEYLDPVNTAHKPLNEVLKANQVLERVRDVLTRVSWPRTLRLTLKGCDGESNAWYVDARVVVCYEYLESTWSSANSSKRPSGISREDAFIGPLVDVFLHEASHALFDLLKIPLLGREEDAADQLATYYMLQFPAETKRKFILGSAYVYADELKVRSVRDLHRRRLKVGRTSLLQTSTVRQRSDCTICSVLLMGRMWTYSPRSWRGGTCLKSGRRFAGTSISRLTLLTTP